MRVEKNDFFIT